VEIADSERARSFARSAASLLVRLVRCAPAQRVAEPACARPARARRLEERVWRGAGERNGCLSAERACCQKPNVTAPGALQWHVLTGRCVRRLGWLLTVARFAFSGKATIVERAQQARHVSALGGAAFSASRESVRGLSQLAGAQVRRWRVLGTNGSIAASLD